MPTVMLPVSRSRASGHGLRSCLWACRNYTSTSVLAQQSRRRIAVLGGGISGLTSAYRLSQQLPKDRYDIVLLESEQRLGGWIESERVSVPSSADETALIERGPRSIRPAGYSGMVMLELLKSLDLLERTLRVPKTAASAQNRYIYYPDRLAKLPNSLASLITAIVQLPFLRRILPGVLREAFTSSRFLRPRSESSGEKQRIRDREHLQDESIDSFVTRRFGKPLAENLVSAVVHGIYAGDTRRLSVRSVLPFLWDSERVHGGVLRSMLPIKSNKRYRPLPEPEAVVKAAKEQALKDVESRLGNIVKTFKDVSVYSFPNGVQELVDALEARLQAAGNVEVRAGDGVRSVSLAKNGRIVLQTTSGANLDVDRVVSSIPSANLKNVLPQQDPLPHLAHNPSANVGVVNLVIKSKDTQKALLPVQGFGYLLPRSTPNNEDGILGVVFDSDSLPTQDTADAAARPIKLTVMMGGSHWSDSAALPSEADMKARAINAVSRHLGLSRELLEDSKQTSVLPVLQKDCIPWYLVGHPTRMADLHKALQSHPTLADRLTLVGASYTGVSLNDCVAYATESVDKIVRAELGEAQSVVTGLESFKVPTHGTIMDAEQDRQSKRAASSKGRAQTQGLFGPTSSPPSSLSFSAVRGLHTSVRRSVEAVAPESTKPTKSLEQILIDSIKASGPMPVSTYMRTCLLDPMQGYYSAANSGTNREVLGSRGDFITSPEISQVFGELVAIFYIARWQSVGAPKQVRLVELGPGKGTLMADMLRTFASFRPFLDSIKTIQLVETSDGLMNLQLEAINEALTAAGKQIVDASKPLHELAANEIVVEWFPNVDMLPVEPEQFTVVTAHEFLDALPTHIFEKGHDGKFREVLVGLRRKSSVTILRPGPVPGTVSEEGGGTDRKDELAFVLSPGPTPWAQMLAQNNPRFVHLKAGQRVEISPESWAITRKIGELVAGRIAAPARAPNSTSTPSSAEQEKETARLAGPTTGGIGLVIDYGDDRFFSASFRAFKAHKLVPVFESPGSVDLTVNVDFQHLKTAIQTTDASWLGPIDQADFLVGMGLQMRTERLVRGKDPENDKRIKQAANRLIDETGMGTQYKVLAISAAPTSGADKDGKLVKITDPQLYPFQLGQNDDPAATS